MEDHRNEEQSGFSSVPEPEITNTNLGSPEVTDCSVDTIPAGTKPEAGKKKIQVPDLVSMCKYLLNKNYANRRLSLYSGMNCLLRSGELSQIVGFSVQNKVINKDVMKLTNVDFWKIDRTYFYANVHIELTLQTDTGTRKWHGLLICLCSFAENKRFTCDIISLTDKAWQDDDENCIRMNQYPIIHHGWSVLLC